MRHLSRALAALALLVSLAVPAEAGYKYWSLSICRPNVWVWDDDGGVAYFYSAWGGYGIAGYQHQLYWRAGGRECGWLNVPTDSGGWYGAVWTQRFVNGSINYNSQDGRWYYCDWRGPVWCYPA